jgi:hypothetical protein
LDLQTAVAQKTKVIDLEFRPETYWPESLTPDQLLSRIHGKARQEIARGIYREKGFAGLSAFLVRDELDEGERQSWGRLHPQFMGGEYLPPLEKDEVEIVRISLKSTTGDQISTRARRDGGVIRYRVVGEYDENERMRYQQPFDQSLEPLTLSELIMLMDGSFIPADRFSGGLVVANWNCAYEDECDVNQALEFVTISSPFYPDLSAYYDELAKQWSEERRRSDVYEDEG